MWKANLFLDILFLKNQQYILIFTEKPVKESSKARKILIILLFMCVYLIKKLNNLLTFYYYLF